MRLSALHSIAYPWTPRPDGLRALARAGKGSVLLDEDVLDRLARFPGALALSGGQLVLPGGHDAEPLWADMFGVPPSRTAAFIRALFHKEAGRGAYTVEGFQQLPDRLTHALLFGGFRKILTELKSQYFLTTRRGPDCDRGPGTASRSKSTARTSSSARARSTSSQ